MANECGVDRGMTVPDGEGGVLQRLAMASRASRG